IIGQHINTPPVAPTWHNPRCPGPLDALIMRLLEKESAKRPTSATEVREMLESLDTTEVRELLQEAPTQTTGHEPLFRRTFVGRESELGQLHAAFDNATSGEGSLLMVMGEPGIGKTTLCEQLSTYVTLRGGRALVGHCYEEGSLSLPYLPFVEAMRSYVISRETDDLKRELGSGAMDVAHIVSEVRDRVGTEPRAPGDPEQDRYRLLHAVTEFLRNAAAVQPLLIVLEDLHDADRGTLDLLLHLARNLGGAMLLVVGTYRDMEVDRSHPLSGTLAELRRASSFARTLLRGLTVDEVHRMMSSIAVQAVSWGLAEAVHRQTEGNPLFIQEVLRYLAEEGLLERDGRTEVARKQIAMSIPEGLRDVIGKRLTRLSDECNRVLAAAAVIGREFAFDTLHAVAGADEESLLDSIEEAVHSGVLEDRSQVGTIRYRFAHAFFRQTLYEGMIAPRRLQLHQKVAQALEAEYSVRPEEHAAELAEHFAHSTDHPDLVKAVRYSEMAAQRAGAVYSYSEVVHHLEQAVQVQEVLDPADLAKRSDLYLALGDALLSAGEALRAVNNTIPQALALAESLDDHGRASRACRMALIALHHYGAARMWGTLEFQQWEQRADYYAAPGTIDRVHADIALGMVKQASGHWPDGLALYLRALELARQLDDPETLIYAAYRVIASPAAVERQELRLRLAEEFSVFPTEGVRVRIICRILLVSGFIYILWGDRAKAEELWRRVKGLAESTRDAQVLLYPRVIDMQLAMFDGDLERVTEIGNDIVDRGHDLGNPVLAEYIASRGALRALIYLGRGNEVPVRVGETSQRALRVAHLGLREEAQAALSEFLAECNLDSEDDETPLPFLTEFLETALLLDDPSAASLLATRISDSAHLSTDDGLFAVSCCPARHLAATEALLGRLEQARARYNQALEVAGKIGFRPETALTHLGLAELLLVHYPEGPGEAMEHLDFAIAEFRDMKMQPSLERALSHRDILKA
ncbi:MAG: AAA family ATPase, partial [Dehalococcoidia bacterium]